MADRAFSLDTWWAGEALKGLFASRGRLVFGLPQLLFTLLCLAAFHATFAAQGDYDYWWHLSVGRYLVAHHALPIPDPFSFTEAGRGWPAHEWLSELVMYELHRVFGFSGPLLLYSLCSVAIIALTIATLRRLEMRLLPLIGCTGAMAYQLLIFSYARPQVAAFALFALLIWLLERWVRRPDRTIWLLPPLFCLWANLHGSFAAGLALPATLLAGELISARLGWLQPRLHPIDRRQLGMALALSLLATTVTPNGPSLLLYPLTKFNDPLLRYLGEWNGTDISDHRNWGFALLAGGYAAALIIRRARPPLSDLLLAASYIFAGFWSLRFVSFAAIILPVLIGRVLRLPNASGLSEPNVVRRFCDWRDALGRRYATPTAAQQTMNVTVGLLAALLVIATTHPYDPAHDKRLPVQAVDRLGVDGLQEPLFNDYNWGGYLIWRLWPARRVFIDGRGDDLYLQDGVFREYVRTVGLQTDPERVLDRYGIRTVLFARDSAFARYLAVDSRWQQTYADATSVRFQRR